MIIPFDAAEPWSGAGIGSKPNTDVNMMAHIALTSLCENCLAAITALPIVLLLIQNQENPVWHQCLEAVSDLEGPHFSRWDDFVGRYAQYLFNLQHNTARTSMQ
jgi:hypothetical protein